MIHERRFPPKVGYIGFIERRYCVTNIKGTPCSPRHGMGVAAEYEGEPWRAHFPSPTPGQNVWMIEREVIPHVFKGKPVNGSFINKGEGWSEPFLMKLDIPPLLLDKHGEGLYSIDKPVSYTFNEEQTASLAYQFGERHLM